MYYIPLINPWSKVRGKLIRGPWAARPLVDKMGKAPLKLPMVRPIGCKSTCTRDCQDPVSRPGGVGSLTLT
eukprot:scaffold1041_cov414-Prasinococcus_capsulatus_cf.AAC.5